MLITSLHLENYRCFDNFDIEFDPKLTVIIGPNGSGKTAVLDALAVFLERANPSHTNQSLTIPVDDIRLNSEHEAIDYTIFLRLGTDEIIREEAGECFTYKFIRDINNDTNLKLDGNRNVDLLDFNNKVKTLSVSYMAGRFLKEDAMKLTNQSTTHAAYYGKAFERQIDYNSTLAWFNNLDADEARTIRDDGNGYINPQLAALREALSKALLNKFEKPRMKGSPPELIVCGKGTNIQYKVSQLSDGYRAMLSLIMDLARRMATSPETYHTNAGAVLATPAIVLIDEIELHLHPSWQQTVLPTLLDIFPNTQFIVTTHSPQILSSIGKEKIRLLKDGHVFLTGEQTEGEEASHILEDIFEVDSRPQNLQIVQSLKRYSELVCDDQWDSPEAIKLYNALAEHFGHEYIKLKELKMYIENRKWEREL
ncbi:MAG: AAA family ATPase [Desulfovibrio sp.]|jgi:predicted ATP-binding protein involved in virulence|nr:AAA family ATPase [Desulfovibrio sp.]